MKILLIDNFDSFTYNLVQLFRESKMCEIDVMPYDQVNSGLINSFDKIVISPGPGIPADFPNLQKWVGEFCDTKSFFGVCLGFEAIALAFGAKIRNSGKVFHGVTKLTTKVNPIASYLFNGIPDSFKAGLYHSWVLEKQSLPESIEILAIADDGVIMAIRHKTYDLHGVQFHPESIMTPHGKKMILNWLQH